MSLFASAMYSLILGACLSMCLRVRVCVHIYVGVYCLSSRYLKRCVSSHVASLLNALYAADFVSTMVLVCFICMCVCVSVWKGPGCIVSDPNFIAG